MTGHLPTHPDDVRAALREAGGRRASAERDRASAMLDTSRWITEGVAAELSISEMSRLTGLTRQTVYDLMRR